MYTVKAYSAKSPASPLAPYTLQRRDPLPHDIQMEVLYCGVCHSDLHQVRNEWADWNPTEYDCVPGHEIVGKVTKVGDKVSKFKVGDYAAVGCMVDSCKSCVNCKDGFEQYCAEGATFTYNSPDKVSGGHTYGGYSNGLTVTESFALRVAPSLAEKNLAAVAPLLCAGITTYSPLRHWKVGPGQKVGIIGLGGLGHMGVKFAAAFGAHVVMITTSPGKGADAERLGAKEVLVSKDPEQMKKHAGTFDFLLDTVAAEHDLSAYLSLLKRDGTMTMVGIPDKPLPIHTVTLAFPRRQLAGSVIGGIPETQEMLDFCAEKGIFSDIELIPIDKINEAYERLLKSDVKYRFVIDMKTV
ncbi:MAG: NAD(P)-dependent alcohol dehydrogenase [Verrucomicrobium sp.]|nr:NAD(P)-dependent alcohol dehydrogenase [Verrucomicrobium sp.]